MEFPERRTLSSRHLIFWVAIAASIGLFFVPAVIIRPFSYQSPNALELAFQVKHYAPVATLVLAVLAAFVAISLWSRVGRRGKVALALGLILGIGSTVMSRLNYFEWMFHPVTSAGFVGAGFAKLDPAEMVMAIKFGNDARAYPINEMAYHHVFNDEVGGAPIVVTY